LLKTGKNLLATETKKIYEELPSIYEFLMRKVSYRTWAHYLDGLVDGYLHPNAKVLELAAGNCKLANIFEKFYPNIIASDLSKNMLASDKKDMIPKVCCNMLALPFKCKFDLIYSTFDSINYLQNGKLLLKMFKEVSAVLNDEGIFTFDASMEKNSLVHTKIPERKGVYKGIKFLQKSMYNSKTHVHTNSFKLKLPNGEVYSEIHRQKIYLFDTYFQLLEKAGLYVVKCYDSFSYRDANPNSERIQFLTKKINQLC